eukprot:1045206-Amorphochlora_amoeboformis.AAC.1
MGDLPRPRLRRAPTTGGDMSRDPTLYFYDGSVIVVTSIIIYLLVVLELVDRRLSAIGVGVFGFLNQLAFGVFYRLIAPTRWHMYNALSYCSVWVDKNATIAVGALRFDLQSCVISQEALDIILDMDSGLVFVDAGKIKFSSSQLGPTFEQLNANCP